MRSALMAKVKARGNKSTELVVAKGFRRAHITGWRRHAKSLPGSPDFFFKRVRLAVFVHGCFWHGCRRCYRPPRSNQEFWLGKVIENRRRDSRTIRQLQRLGISTMTIWEHDVKSEGWLDRVRRSLAKAADRAGLVDRSKKASR